MIVVPKAARVKQLTTLKTEIFDTGKLKLFQNNVSPTVNTVVGDLDEADFTGYAEKTVTAYGAAFLDPSNNATILSPVETWTATVPNLVPQTVYGVYALDADGDLAFMERFATPVEIPEAGGTVAIVAKYQQGLLNPVP